MTITFAGAALAGAIGVSRIYLGVHWMSDVVCGWAVASLWLVTLLLIGWAGPRIWNEGRGPVDLWTRRDPTQTPGSLVLF